MNVCFTTRREVRGAAFLHLHRKRRDGTSVGPWRRSTAGNIRQSLDILPNGGRSEDTRVRCAGHVQSQLWEEFGNFLTQLEYIINVTLLIGTTKPHLFGAHGVIFVACPTRLLFHPLTPSQTNKRTNKLMQKRRLSRFGSSLNN